MNQLHQKLMIASDAYRDWHLNKDYHIRHWVIFFGVVVVMFVFLSKQVNEYIDIGLYEGRAGGTVISADYYVSTSGSDTNLGSESAPFRTIQKAATVVQAGQTVVVLPGTYDERVIPVRSGISGNPIIFKAFGVVKVRGFSLNNRSYIVVDGFEITGQGMTNATYEPAAVFMESSHNIQVLNNYIHDTASTPCIRMRSQIASTVSNNNLIKGNTISHCSSLSTQSMGIGIEVFGSSNLIEDNDISHLGDDFTRVTGGERNVVRNNVFHDNSHADFPGSTAHIDGMQNWCSVSVPVRTRYLLIENNRMLNTPSVDTHFVIYQDMAQCGNSDFVIRYNSVTNNGSYVEIMSKTNRVYRYHNTFVNTSVAVSPKAWNAVGNYDNSPNGRIINNIFSDTVRNGGYVYGTDSTSVTGFDAHHNLAQNTGYTGSWGSPIKNEIGVILNQSPGFISTSDYNLQSSSPAIDKGGPLTKIGAVDFGTGAVITVEDAGLFQDGWAGVNSDWVAIGNAQNFAKILSIDYSNHSITLDRALARSKGDPVWLFRDSTGRQVLYSSAPDIGAYEYVSGTVTTPTPSITVSGSPAPSPSTSPSITPTSTLTPPPSPSPTITPTPIVISTKFKLGDRVRVSRKLNVRSSPSLTGVNLGTQPKNALGTIISGPITANGYIWYQVNYDNVPDGWSVQNYLRKL